MKILNITGVLPSAAKKTDNDILLVIADNHKVHFAAQHSFILFLPYVNKLLSGFSALWNNYYKLRKEGRYVIRGYAVNVIPMITLKSDLFRHFLFFISYHLNKKKLLRIIENEQPDIIHAQNVLSCAYVARKLSFRTKIPYVITAREFSGFSHYKFVRQNINDSKAIIFLNDDQRKSYELLNLQSPAFLLPHGVDDVFFNTVTADRDDNITKLISICWLRKTKNIHLVVEALKEIKSPFIYDIYGDGPFYEEIDNLIKELKLDGSVNLKGKIQYEDVPNVLADYDIFVLPSYPETFGRVYIEAMACGLSIVGTKGAGIDGYIVDGDSGHLVDLDSQDHLRTVLDRLITDEKYRKVLAANSRTISERFRWKKVVAGLNDIYASVV